jgi:hypothetical protein
MSPWPAALGGRQHKRRAVTFFAVHLHALPLGRSQRRYARSRLVAFSATPSTDSAEATSQHPASSLSRARAYRTDRGAGLSMSSTGGVSRGVHRIARSACSSPSS